MAAARIAGFLLVVLSGLPVAAAPASFLEQDMCVRCHLLGENLGAPTPVLSWKRSVHFRADSGCADCHGGDKYFYADLQRGHLGLPDAAAAIAQCVKCHAREKPPAIDPSLGEPGKFKCTVTCIDCHGYHQVEKASSDLINEVTCGRCHSFTLVKPHQMALARTEAGIAALAGRIDRIEAQDLPVARLRQELEAVKADYADLFHQRRPGQFEAAAAALLASLPRVEARIDRASPYKWYLSGTVVVGFLLAIVVLLIGYQSVAGSIDAGKEDTDMAEAKGLKSPEPKCKGAGPGAWTARLALLIALVALVLAISEKRSSTPAAGAALNQTVAGTLAPGLKRANDRATVNAVYELKRMAVTLDELRENNPDPEVRARIDKLKIELQELAVKVLVYE